jgi:hypothetical protein
VFMIPPFFRGAPLWATSWVVVGSCLSSIIIPNRALAQLSWDEDKETGENSGVEDTCGGSGGEEAY